MISTVREANGTHGTGKPGGQAPAGPECRAPLAAPAAARVDRVLRAERPVRAHAFIAGRENVLMVADARPAGRWEPAELGVHPVAGGGPDGPVPVYVRRPHDELLRLVLDPEGADRRRSGVRGEDFCGKSRAAYEAVAGRVFGVGGGG